VLKQGLHRKGVPVAERSADTFFAPLTREQDWYGPGEKAEAARCRALLEAMKRPPSGPRVFRVGSRKRTVYVVGRAGEGGWAGLKATAVEARVRRPGARLPLRATGPTGRFRAGGRLGRPGVG
jgi:hypothetical protein